MGRLVAERSKLRKAKLERKSPARSNRAESVIEQPPARSRPNAQPDRAKPESSTGPSPWLAARWRDSRSPCCWRSCGGSPVAAGTARGASARLVRGSVWCAQRCSRRTSSAPLRARYSPAMPHPIEAPSRAPRRPNRGPADHSRRNPRAPRRHRLCAAAGGPGARAAARRGIRPNALLQRHPGALRERRVRARGGLQPPGWHAGCGERVSSRRKRAAALCAGAGSARNRGVAAPDGGSRRGREHRPTRARDPRGSRILRGRADHLPRAGGRAHLRRSRRDRRAADRARSGHAGRLRRGVRLRARTVRAHGAPAAPMPIAYSPSRGRRRRASPSSAATSSRSARPRCAFRR